MGKHLPFILLVRFLLGFLGNLAPKGTINSFELPLLCLLVVSLLLLPAEFMVISRLS